MERTNWRLEPVFKMINDRLQDYGSPEDLVRNSMEPIFEVIDGDNHYKIWEDGHIEGFGDDVIVVNRIPVVTVPRTRGNSPPTSFL